MRRIRHSTLVAALAWCALPLFAAAAEEPTPVAAGSAEVESMLADAQQRLDAAAREVAELSRQLGRRFNLHLGVEPGGTPPPRAMLGVNIGMDEGQGGVRVVGVSPGGAAAEAGIRQGDVITSVAGEDLTQTAAPGRVLVERIRQLEPNLKVQVGVLREGKKLMLDVTPRAAPMGGPMGLGQMREFRMQRGPGAMGPEQRMERMQMMRGDGARFRDMEFATLSERLGSYFGVKAGVLVVRAGGNSAFKLQDGDVILSIDGRAATSAQHAGRILRSYQAGEKLTLRVQRDRKPQVIDITLPVGDPHD